MPGRATMSTTSRCRSAVISLGVPAGASSASQSSHSMSPWPASAMVGTSGSTSIRLPLITASARSLPSLTCGAAVAALVKPMGVARDHRGDRRSRAVEGDVHEVETKRQAERFAYEMAGLPDPGGRVAVLAGTGFDQRDQLIDRLRRQRGVYAERHHVGDGDRDGVEVLVGVVGDRAVEARIDDVAAGHDEDRVTVGRRLRGPAHTDIAPSARYVFHVELLAGAVG